MTMILKSILQVFLFFVFYSAFQQLSGQVIIENIYFHQDNKTFHISKQSDSLVLERKPFSIYYYGKKYNSEKEEFYSAQIAILDNAEDTLLLKSGKPTYEITFFEPGSGLAPYENGMYDTVFITNSGHHYLIYENENEKRVNLISQIENYNEFEWKIKAVHYQEKNISLSDITINTLYFVIFMDRNLNEIIDTNELKIVTIQFY